jgi:ParB family chromosome partitioning protein
LPSALLAAADLAAEVVPRRLNVRPTERLIQRRAKVPRNPQTRDADTTTLERELSAALDLRVTIESKSVVAP